MGNTWRRALATGWGSLYIGSYYFTDLRHGIILPINSFKIINWILPCHVDSCFLFFRQIYMCIWMHVINVISLLCKLLCPNKLLYWYTPLINRKEVLLFVSFKIGKVMLQNKTVTYDNKKLICTYNMWNTYCFRALNIIVTLESRLMRLYL